MTPDGAASVTAMAVPPHDPATPSSAADPSQPDVLPVETVLPALRAALAARGLAVLQAPPGAGKTTRVPLALLDDRPGRILVLEPRRVAARAAAQRLAAHLGERVGVTVGLTTRDETRTSRHTRIEVVTEGVVLRRLQRDPALTGTRLVLFDEFHERSLPADLALAFALETRAALREDLELLVASATLDGWRVARLLGGQDTPAPVVTAEGRTYPVDIEHRSRPPADALPEAVAATVVEVVVDTDGHVLVFLPGAAEIRRTYRVLAERSLPRDTRVLPLHGSLSAAAQDAALAPVPPGVRKVVLATDLAESSVTIAGVSAVVDAGRSREPRFDPATGMSGLVTVAASRASADQRAGRAGRTGPGRCIRLWPAREHAGRDAHPRPAIVTDDLTGAALEVAAWGAEVDTLALLDPPPPQAWRRARRTLTDLGGLDTAGRVTAHGRALAALPLHPRLGHVVLRARELEDAEPAHASGLGHLAAELAAVLADRDPLVVPPGAPTADLAARVRVLRGDPPPPGTGVRRDARERARREVRRLVRALDLATPSAPPDPDRVGLLVALGWPERVASRRGHRRGAFVLAAGRGATLPEEDLLADAPLLAVAHLDRGAREARIHLAAPISADELRRILPGRIGRDQHLCWHDGDVVAEEREVLGAVVLGRTPLADPPSSALLAALLDGLRTEGLGLLAWTDDDQQLRARVALLRRELGEAWPDLSDAALLADLENVVAPFLLRARRRADLRMLRAGDVLRARLDHRQRPALDRLAPTHLTVPSGARRRLDYLARDRPVLAVRVQELFGSRRTPTIVDGRVLVLLELLSPAQRPVQVTDDLAGFWDRVYPQVRAELRGRYPKHAWPEDPRTATPTDGVGRRR
jgi:ATP-dependent helicase HrpB